MSVEQLPARMREFVNYLDGLLARLDQGAGWCGVFWQRDPDGMQACLDGREVPPWDVVEALLHDLAAQYGPGGAGPETERARALHAAALAAYDARPGARDALGDRLDVMLREQRYAVERQAELGRLLAAATSQEEADAFRVDLAWARDDHERATARCAELRDRMADLDRRAASGRGQAIRRERERERVGEGAVFRVDEGIGGDRFRGEGFGDDRFGGEGAEDERSGGDGFEDERFGGGRSGRDLFRGDGSLTEGSPGRFGGGRSERDGLRGAGSGADGSSAAEAVGWPEEHRKGTYEEAGRRTAAPAGAGADRREARRAVAPAAWRSGTGPSERPDAQGPGGAGMDHPDAHRTPAHPTVGDPTPAPAAEPDPGPASTPRQRKRRRGSARFAGIVEEEATPVVVPPTAAPALPAPPVTARRTPRGARFAGADEETPVPTATAPRAEPMDAADRREVSRTVETLVRLRGEGRSGEAHVLLVEAAYWPAARFPALAIEMERAGLGADWATLLWEAASLPAERLVSAADALTAAGRTEDGERILRQGVARPAHEIGQAVVRLAGEGRRRAVSALLDAYVSVRTPEEAARSVAPDPKTLVPLLLEAARGVSDERHWDLVHALRVAGFTA
ncbi:hypothetical protein ABZ078_40850 [Streptomyces sp. NPDC006385]|uniref:hypothetical protein n=1 Tax=Streptomyces sp. NPDC006385 TaxID=3156761 RepID=UPI0033BDE97D